MIPGFIGKPSWRTSFRLYLGKGALWRFGTLLAGMVFCSSTPGADSPAAGFRITSKGQPKGEIVVEGEHLEGPIAFAAQELQRYVKEMSGAELPVVQAPSKKPAIVLAVRPLQPDQKPSEDPREVDHYRLSVDAGKLKIEGASPRAVLFGVYDLLD